jgi:hypothetical protein
MGRLLDLAKAISAEHSLWGRLGRWILAVSTTLDSTSTRGYVEAKNDGDQLAVGAGTNILLQTTIANRNIDRAGGVSEMEFELEAGKTYLLSAHGWATTFSDAVDGQLGIRWVDGNNASVPVGGSDAQAASWSPLTDDSAQSADPVTDVIFEVPASATLAERRVHLRCTTATGTATVTSVQGTITEL